MEHFDGIIALIGIVVVVAALLSGVVERTRIPLVAVFLVLGLVIGPTVLGLVDVGIGSPALRTLATLALAMVLFQDAIMIGRRELREHRAILWRVLGPGTVLPGAMIALAGVLLLGLPVLPAVILGAALASTDPVLLRGVLRGDAMPPPARVALRIETGMNDVILLPIVIFSMLLMQAGPGGPTSADVLRRLAGMLVLGPAAGALVGWLGITVLVAVRSRGGVRRDYESIYAIGLAFTAFALAESLGGSGFLAAFAAGLMISFRDVELCDCFREYGEATAEMLLLLTFVALGTTLMWRGLAVVSAATLAFAAIALVARSLALYPVLAGAGLHGRDRKLIALLGPRGLSSLLLVLLPVFAGIGEAEGLFAIASLVVLLSVLLHGGGLALFLRKAGVTGVTGGRTGGGPDGLRDGGAAAPPEKITIDELRALQASGAEVVIVDSRATRSYEESDTTAAGSVRLDPDNAVRDARVQRLSQRATLVVYCA